jgi:hypothetical protein
MAGVVISDNPEIGGIGDLPSLMPGFSVPRLLVLLSSMRMILADPKQADATIIADHSMYLSTAVGVGSIARPPVRTVYTRK